MDSLKAEYISCKCEEPFFKGHADAPESIKCENCGEKPSKNRLKNLLKEVENSKEKRDLENLKRSTSRKKNDNWLSKKVKYKA